jgi:sugar lactone lactonase YvrE
MEALVSGFDALEGATADADGALLFSDLRAGGVRRLNRCGATELVVADRKAVGGICHHAAGGLVVSGPDLCHVNGSTRRVLLDLGDIAERPGAVAVGFNDIAADRLGRLYAGVIRRSVAGQPVPGELVRVSAARECAVIHDDIHPNGMGFSPDRSRLYVSDTYGRRLIVFAVRDDELPIVDTEISTKEIAGLPDGLAVDAEGCLWVAFYRGSAVVRFAPDGEIIRRVPVPALKPLSVCLAGQDDPTLYVVTATREPGSDETGTVYRMGVEVAPDPPDPVRV